MGKIRIGWAESNITPEKKISLAGQFAERISEYVEKPLTVTAMAVECDGDQMILVSCDLVSIRYGFMKDIRACFEGNADGIDPEKIIVCAIHTHTGYRAGGVSVTEYGNRVPAVDRKKLLVSFMKPGQKYIEKVNVSDNPEIATAKECHDLALQGIVSAVKKAWSERKEAQFANAFDRAAVGMCRRVDYSDGTAQMWGNANTAVFTEMEGGNDSGVELLYCFDTEKKLTGVVVNLACPAQCVQHRLFVSPDFWGETKKLLRERFGEDIFMLPVCAPAGDQCPVDLVRWVNPETDVHDPNLIRNHPPVRKADPSMFDLAGMKKAGKRVANAVIDAFEEGNYTLSNDIRFEHHVHVLELPLRRATLSEYNDAMKNVRDYVREKDGDIDYNDVAKLQRYLGIISRFSLQEKIETVESEVHVVRMGRIAFATDPFELYLDYGNQIRARALCEQVFLVQLACGAEGYLPTEKAEKHGHYSGFIASGKVGHEGGDQLVRETLKDINQMFADDYQVYTYKEE